MDYGEFLGGLEPTVLGLDKATSLVNRHAYWSPSQNARRVLSSKYTLAKVAGDYFDVEATFGVTVEWSDNDGPIVQALRIECVFTGHFHTNGPFDRKHAEKFAETESWLIFWPYFRQFVADTTSRMAIPPLLVPLAVGPGEHAYRRGTPKAIGPGRAPKALGKSRKTPKK